MGYILLSLAGISANLIGISPFIAEAAVVLIGAFLSLRYRDRLRGELDRDDWVVLGTGSFYIFLLIAFFDHIVMWMAGDAVAHASIIRMLLDGEQVPISIYPFGSYWEYYPKAFHLYSYFYASIFPILNVVQTIPIIITAITPALLYSIVREMERKEVALFAFVIACFLFLQHYMYLIWAGYTSATAEMLLVAFILAAVVEKRLFPLILLGIVFTHTRFLAYLAGIVAVWLGFEHLNKRHLPYVLFASVILFIIAAKLFGVHRPEFLMSIISSQELATEYVSRWYPALLSAFGVVMAFYRRDRLDRLVMAWALAVVIMVFVSDIGIFDFGTSPDRVLSKLYLPLCVLAAYSVFSINKSMHNFETSRPVFLLLIIVIGTASMGAVFYNYAESWGLPEEDYRAMNWLGEHNFSDAVCINSDQTGAWAYPLTGIKVADQIIGPQMYYGFKPFGYQFFQKLRADPNDPLVIETIKNSEYGTDLIYVSKTSISRPGYRPPFTKFHGGSYPVQNLDFSSQYYDLIYDEGTRIFQFKNTHPKENHIINSFYVASTNNRQKTVCNDDANMVAGFTYPGDTKWQQYGENGIYVDVDTSQAGFAVTPLYFTSLGGDLDHYMVTGSTSIYDASPIGFRIYLHCSDETAISPEIANEKGWHILWIAVSEPIIEA